MNIQPFPEQLFRQERADLAAAFRWAARLNLHEAVANHFSLAVDAVGKRFLMNPNQRHFSLIRASDLLLLDADDPGRAGTVRMRRTRLPGDCTGLSIAVALTPAASCIRTPVTGPC